MITVLTQTALLKYDKYLQIYSFDNELLSKAMTLFQEYKEQGVILNAEFEDNIWILTDELTNVSLRFDIDEDKYYSNANMWTACDLKCYMEAVKVYATFMLGAHGLGSIREIVNCAVILGHSSFEDATQFISGHYHLAEMIKMLPGYSSQRDAVVECLEENQLYWGRGRKRRVLKEFTAYFRFNEMLEHYWITASEQKKLFYFPIMLWWKITSILPLRPTEFVLTPRDCLRRKEGKYLLTIRRTKLKGAQKKRAYKIDEDYQRYEYIIPDEIAEIIIWYIDKTNDMQESPWGCLFRKAANRSYIERHGLYYQNGAYTYAVLSSTLGTLYDEAGIGENDRLHLGDSRHIAMMNLIISGGSPTICMELAGHSNIDISSHYYSNMSTLVECATYELYRKTKNKRGVLLHGSNRRELNKKLLHENCVEVENGWCSSDAWKVQDISDCIQVVNSEGHIADCVSCKYYIPQNPGLHLDFYDVNEGKKALDADIWFLIQMIKNVRRGIGIQDDISTSILKLQKSAYHYRDCIVHGWEMDIDGKTEKDR